MCRQGGRHTTDNSDRPGLPFCPPSLPQVWRYYLLAVRPETSDSGEPVAPAGPLLHRPGICTHLRPTCTLLAFNALIFTFSLCLQPSSGTTLLPRTTRS